MAKKKPVDPREWAKRALVNALKRAEAAGDLPGIVQSARAVLAEFPEPPPRDPRAEQLTREQIEARLLHMLNKSRVQRGQPLIEVPGALPLATGAEVEAKLRELTSRGVHWRLFLDGSVCIDKGWLSESDLIFILVNHRSDVLREVHATHGTADRQPIATLRDAPAPVTVLADDGDTPEDPNDESETVL